MKINAQRYDAQWLNPQSGKWETLAHGVGLARAMAKKVVFNARIVECPGKKEAKNDD